MNILQLFGSLNRGGAEVLTYDVCRYYPDKYGKIFLVTYWGGDMEDTFALSNIPVYKNRKGLFGISLIKSLRSFVKQYSIQVIHVHKSIDVLYAQIACIGLKVKIVQTVHSIGTGKQYLILRKAVKGITDHLFFVSHDILKKYSSNNPLTKRYSVLYNGIDPIKFQQKNKLLFNEFNIPKEGILAGMVGNFYTESRDQFTVCNAVKKIITDHLNFQLIFIGGKSKSNTEPFEKCYHFCKKNKLMNNVHFLGSREDIPQILASLDLFVYSSNRDTFGIAVVEAMMSGTPVIVNDLPVFQEITDNGNYAQLYKTKDADDLAEKIEYFIRHPEARAELGERGRKWALENYSIEKHIEQLHAIYTELLSD